MGFVLISSSNESLDGISRVLTRRLLRRLRIPNANDFRGRYDVQKAKFFLARILVEVDVTNRPDFDERQAADYFSSVFSLSGNDRKLEVTVRELKPKACCTTDVEIEEYEYRGFVITIHQSADTVGTAVPTYFGVVAKPNSESGRVMADYSQFIEVAKNDAEIYVDKRVSRSKQQ